MKMSGPNGDPEVTADEGIVEDEDDFNEEGEFDWDTCKQQMCRFEMNQVFICCIYLLYLSDKVRI